MVPVVYGFPSTELIAVMQGTQGVILGGDHVIKDSATWICKVCKGGWAKWPYCRPPPCLLAACKETEDGEDKTIWLLRYYSVFNALQCEGLPLPDVSIDAREFDPKAEAEGIIASMPSAPSIGHDGGDRAYYIPARDSIHLPPRYAFEKPEEYYSTAFHELGHSTGHKSRLDRHGLETGIAAFGSQVYSKEELAAEFCSTFLCNESGIKNTLDNSTAYIQGWAKKLRSDKRLVIVAASQGQKAADYILGRGGE